MTSEVCPFCGKTYKRLKSHLPHCKAAARSQTPPIEHDVTANETSPSRSAADLTKSTAKGEKPAQTPSMAASPQTKKSKKVSTAPPPQSSSTAAPLQSASTSKSSSAKKKKQKLSEQIKAATMPPSTTMPLISTQSQSPPQSPTISKPQNKRLHALIEAAKSKQVPKGSLEGTRSASEDLSSASAPFVSDPLRSRTTAQTDSKTHPKKDLVKDNPHPDILSTDTKPKGAFKMKASKAKKAAQSLSTTKDASSSLDSEVNEKTLRPRVRDDFLVDNQSETEDLSGNEMFLKSGSGHRARITLQDVKATLGRANTTRKSSRPSILGLIETADDISSKIRPDASLSLVPPPTGKEEAVDSCLVTKTLSDKLPSTSSQHAELQSVKKISSNSKQASLIPLQHDGSPQAELTSCTTPLPSGHLLSQVMRAKDFPPHTFNLNERLNVGHHMTGHLFPPSPQNPPARVEIFKAVDGLMAAKSQLGVMKQNTADNGTKGALTQQSLGQVRLRDLPEWLSGKSPRRPRDVLAMVQRGWQWYYRRYIDVRKGGVGGLSMLLAGYCVLSYIWSYPHIKRDRWRKYH
uniref:polycystic kidney disease protein 1-like 3 n=1 Tax=Scatophagus argus TaxID=75038 RepID=UPI001ED7F515|nr:polycystic kidney disease protein 1-like 3 [Scatophagus argus]XP_046233944.1 polycystic kidney disease protein 1-like 3 [Scatophagus argus]XP_046233945.1 polycystic kidney disease protein 1-like 3 [Scatophagus argus]XP_046233946.1 polycystic kidney disease protein 1-like 3 [Scatophagus argus]